MKKTTTDSAAGSQSARKPPTSRNNDEAVKTADSKELKAYLGGRNANTVFKDNKSSQGSAIRKKSSQNQKQDGYASIEEEIEAELNNLNAAVQQLSMESEAVIDTRRL